jgi:hypothetical protein
LGEAESESESETTNKRVIEAKTIVFLNGFLCINAIITLCYIEIILLETEFMLLLYSIEICKRFLAGKKLLVIRFIQIK